MKRWVLLIACALLAFGLGTTVLAQDEPGVLRVDASQTRGPISPYVLGANFGIYGVLTVDNTPLYEESGVTFIRFNGGGDSERRDMTEMQIDQWVAMAERIGAEPLLSVRSQDTTPEAAAALVQYTVDQGYDVRYWSIGNEPNHLSNMDGVYTAAEHNRIWREIAEAMLEVNPDIILLGPDVGQYLPDPAQLQRDPEGREWVSEFLLANGDLVDIVTIHRYPFPQSMANPITPVEDMRANPVEWESIIPNLRQSIRETTGRDIPVAVTEVNSHWSTTSGGETSADSHLNAVWLADVMGRLIRQRVEIIAYWDLESHGQRGGFGLLSNYEARPTYYTYQMYRRLGSELVFTEAADTLVTVYAALREDGALTVMVINLADDAQTRTLELAGFEPGGDAEVWRFDETTEADVQIDDMALADGDEVTLPGRSLTLFIVPPAE